MGLALRRDAMPEYTVIYEKAADGGWGSYVPDLPGLGVIGDTLEETKLLIRRGIPIHLESLVADGLPIPTAMTFAGTVSVRSRCFIGIHLIKAYLSG